ncbi:MAG: aminopeptidase P N-terminal domain-containing protein [Bacteriovoracaceae bacterium]|nr:aminopeptidase P N-terminal domain-containing protein [Bacteriovoracaceae bacterium]
MEETSFISRQDNLLKSIDEGIVIIPGAGLKQKSHDTEFPFRQNSDFKYFTGFNEPDATLVLKKTIEGEVERHLFLQEKNPEMEMWTGIRLGSEKAPEVLPIDSAYPNHEFTRRLPDLFKGHKNLYYNLFNHDLQSKVTKALKSLGGKRKEKYFTPLHWHHLSPLIGMLRLRKDQNEILAMKQAAELSDIGHRAAMALAAPGVNEKEIDQLLSYLFAQENGEGPAYDSIVAGGTNALILHYIANNQNLKDGDLLLIDAGAQVNTYASDVTRTFPVNGVFSPAQKDLYQVVLNSQKVAMGHMKIGATLKEIHTSTCQILLKSLIEADILKGSFEELWEKDAYRAYYPHGTGHWLGLDVHDQSPYLDNQLEELTLDEGMVFTCEPGLYLPVGDASVPSKWQGMGIRIEDDILITQSGPENLTRSIPKEVKEIEEACKEDIKTILSKLSSPSLLS